MTITKKQNSLLHGLLSAQGLMPLKEALVQAFTEGRSRSSKDLTYQEAGALITHLKESDSGHKMRRKIIRLAHEMGWHLTPGPSPKGEGRKPCIDMERLDTWCRTYGYGKKALNEYNNKELPKLVSQFENGPYKHYLQSL